MQMHLFLMEDAKPSRPQTRVWFVVRSAAPEAEDARQRWGRGGGGASCPQGHADADGTAGQAGASGAVPVPVPFCYLLLLTGGQRRAAAPRAWRHCGLRGARTIVGCGRNAERPQPRLPPRPRAPRRATEDAQKRAARRGGGGQRGARSRGGPRSPQSARPALCVLEQSGCLGGSPGNRCARRPPQSPRNF